MTTRKEFEAKFKETGKNIDELVSNTSENFRDERTKLKDKWHEMDQKRASVAEDDESAWDEVKEEMHEGWDHMEKSYQDLKHKISSNHEGHSH